MRHLRLLLASSAGALILATTAQAADLIVSQPGYAMATAPYSAASWDGLYFGGHVGYGWGTAAYPEFPAEPDLDMAGFFAGVQAGYNATVAPGFVAGIEADVSWSNIAGNWEDDVTHTIHWMGSLRGRIGINAGTFLPYLTAGLAVANASIVEIAPPMDFSATHVGWTVGAGVEVAMTDNTSLKLEYRYSDFGEQDFGADVISLNAHTIQAGFNWRF